MRPLLCAILAGVTLTGQAWTKHWHDDDKHWRTHGKHDVDDRDYDHRAQGCHFQPREVRAITEYYAPRYRSLPPGLQKKLYRTGQLPPGWQKKLEPLPAVLERQLVPVPAGYQRGFMDGYVVMYQPRTQVIVDIVTVYGR